MDIFLISLNQQPVRYVQPSSGLTIKQARIICQVIFLMDGGFISLGD